MAYSNLAQLRMLAGDPEGTERWGTRALDLARAVGARDVEIHALNNLGTIRWSESGSLDGRTQLVRSLDLALAAGLHEHAARAYTNLGAIAVSMRRYAEAESHLHAGIAYCEERDLDSWRLYMTSWLATAYADQGRADEAQRCVDEVLRQPLLSPVARIPALVVAGRLAAGRGDDPTALLTTAAELASGTGEPQRLLPVALARAEAAWLGGAAPADRAAAVASAHGLIGRAGEWELGELAWWSSLAGVRLDTGDRPVAAPFVQMLAGRFADAAVEWERIGASPWRATCLGLVQDAPTAREGFDQAEALGAPALREALTRERHARGLPLPRAPRASTRQNAYGLTARELDVLALVAEGLTNAEVAQRLFLSEKTVGHHVSAVLRKTGEPTRARAAAAFRRGQLRPT